MSHQFCHLYIAEVDSTMEEVRRCEWPETDFTFGLLTTDFQRAGRGQRGTHWESERGSNLLFSLLFHPAFLPVGHQFLLSAALALSVCEALKTTAANNGHSADDCERFCVKWPNDVYYADQKICGMLLEHNILGESIQTSVAGVGINVNQKRFFSDAPNPISLCKIVAVDIDREALLADVCAKFLVYYERLKQEDWSSVMIEYKHNLYRREGIFPFSDNNGIFMAKIEDVLPNGMLQLRDKQGDIRTYAFKEVSYVINPSNNS